MTFRGRAFSRAKNRSLTFRDCVQYICLSRAAKAENYDALHILWIEMLRLATLLPEFDAVMAMYGAGKVTGPQLMAEIGDVRCFTHKGVLVAFAGMDAPPFQSGTFASKSRRISKRGSPHMRKTLVMVVSTILQHSDPADPMISVHGQEASRGQAFLCIHNGGCCQVPAYLLCQGESASGGAGR